MQLLVQNTTGDFLDETASRLPQSTSNSLTWQRWTDLVDIDGDNDLDIVIQRQYPETAVGIYLNNGNGVFTAMSDDPALSNFRGSFTLMDVNNDQMLDVVNPVYQYESLGIGYFQHIKVALNGLSSSLDYRQLTGDSSVNTLIGGAVNDLIHGLGENDILIGLGGNDTIDGGAGLDKVLYAGASVNYAITHTDTGFTVTDLYGTDGADTLLNVERLEFADARIALDIDGNAGKVYRLYEAAFNRTPDKPGLAYWIWQADAGASFTQIASAFTGGIEFQNKYGILSNNQFIEQLYLNILDRPGEAAGLAYWQWQLNDGFQTREEVLYGFSESYENQIHVIGQIENGIDYTT
jgi:hypothetical protein